MDRRADNITTNQVLRLEVGQPPSSMQMEDLYFNQSLAFCCKASMSCFSKGIQWAIKAVDGELIYLGNFSCQTVKTI